MMTETDIQFLLHHLEVIGVQLKRIADLKEAEWVNKQ